MSEMGQSRRFGSPTATSGLPRSTDIGRPIWLVRLVPFAEFVVLLIRGMVSAEQGFDTLAALPTRASIRLTVLSRTSLGSNWYRHPQLAKSRLRSVMAAPVTH